jgi:hypothetical protein
LEIILAVALLAVGLLLVPAAVYWVGSAVVGDYAGDGGAGALISKIWADAGRGRLTAWVLFLAPYLIVQLLRLSWAVMRSRRAVTELTNT